jgi:hypothetical protein
MLFCQQRDPARLPAAYPPTNSASAAPPEAGDDRHADLKPVSVIKARG